MERAAGQARRPSPSSSLEARRWARRAPGRSPREVRRWATREKREWERERRVRSCVREGSAVVKAVVRWVWVVMRRIRRRVAVVVRWGEGFGAMGGGWRFWRKIGVGLA
ncbi:hypothetical protein vseg_007355 [Gypsophila vaccaria]